MTQTTTTQSSTCVQGESGRKYRLLSPLAARVPHKRDKPTSHIWEAVDIQDESQEFIIKQPYIDDDASRDWPLFQHEVEMQRRFAKSPFIRQMVDYTPRTGSTPCMMVLQAFEQSLWTARNQRPLTIEEIKWIMKAVLIGLWTIHREGLVYSDLKMENILLNGFDETSPGGLRSIVARLADCGAITPPSPTNREITSIAYRSPEVHFRRPWTSSTDIWSWGIVYCHLLEARLNPTTPGIYDSITKGTTTLEEKAQAVRNAIAHDFSLHSIPFYTEEDVESFNLLPPVQGKCSQSESEDDWWGARLLRKGVSKEDVAFLAQVLVPDPRERPGAGDIVKSGFLDV